MKFSDISMYYSDINLGTQVFDTVIARNQVTGHQEKGFFLGFDSAIHSLETYELVGFSNVRLLLPKNNEIIAICQIIRKSGSPEIENNYVIVYPTRLVLTEKCKFIDDDE